MLVGLSDVSLVGIDESSDFHVTHFLVGCSAFTVRTALKQDILAMTHSSSAAIVLALVSLARKNSRERGSDKNGFEAWPYALHGRFSPPVRSLRMAERAARSKEV